MKVLLFYHSLYSDWNHGNAHFLRGIAGVLRRRGHTVCVFEPRDAWSMRNLLTDHGPAVVRDFRQAYPGLKSTRYDMASFDVEAALHDADLVIVHEWNDPALVSRISRHHRANPGYVLLFHDTHHRCVSAPDELARYDLDHYDGVLAFGRIIRDYYLTSGQARRAFIWHEAADTDIFRPMPPTEPMRDLVWIGNWGDGERAEELRTFLITPVRDLRLSACVYGVRYPRTAIDELRAAGIEYRGWLPNFRVPAAMANFHCTIHVPRRQYATELPGIPTIRVFEALACGMPLISAPWRDVEQLFTPGTDFQPVQDGDDMRRALRTLLENPDRAAALGRAGRATILRRHTCEHRVDELMTICASLPRADQRIARRPASHTTRPMRIAFFGSSLVSAYWNGAATYYRGLIRSLHKRGHRVTFYEPDAFERQAHRDIADPPYARSVVYAATQQGVHEALQAARSADLVVKASGVGVFDALLEAEVLALQTSGRRVVYWDVDAPATLERLEKDPRDPFRPLIPRFDVIFTYGGGKPVQDAYEALGARQCVPIYNALDPTTHYPVPTDPRFDGTLNFLGNRMPDREDRVREFFFESAGRLPAQRFLLGGSGWDRDIPNVENVKWVGHVYTRDHNAFNCSPMAVLNISRDSMARFGYSPATRIFEAAGAGACIITDEWKGIDMFLEPDRECFMARDHADVARHLQDLTRSRAQAVGAAARQRVLAHHTYARRAVQVEAALAE